MSKLGKLINECCPNGVEYKPLGEIGKVSMCKRILKSETNSVGGIPFYKIGTFGRKPDSYISQEKFDEYKRKYPFPVKGDILISAAGTIGKTVIYDGEPAYYQDSNIVWLAHDESVVLNKYLYYCYQTQPWKVSSGGTISRLYNENITKAEIPVPPLPVQQEIVRILDSFTSLTAELEAELEARKKQYEYYRDQLLTFDVPEGGTSDHYKGTVVRFISLDKASKMFKGSYITQKNSHKGNIPVILGGQEPAYYVDKSNHDGEVVVVSRSGASAGFVSYWDEPIFITDGFGFEAYPNIVIPKYLYYVLKNRESELNKMKRGAGVPHINGKALSKINIPVPAIETQKHIVATLDRFDALCNDLTSGLPAEIEARQKQYEYYRDKLLTFQPLNS